MRLAWRPYRSGLSRSRDGFILELDSVSLIVVKGINGWYWYVWDLDKVEVASSARAFPSAVDAQCEIIIEYERENA